MSSDTIEDKELLKSKIVDIREMIAINEEELERIKNDEIVEILENYDDIEIYFSMMKDSLKEEYERLKEAQYVSSKAEEDSYWSEEF